MPNKILLIRPHNIYNYNNYPPLNLISIGTQLKTNGFDVKIINCAFNENYLDMIRYELGDTMLVGISLLTSETPDALNILRYIKKYSNVPVVAGGWHCSLFPDQMASSGYVDYVVSGEGEKHMLHIAEAIRDRKGIKRNIFYKEIIELESLAVPDYSIDENIERYIGSYLTDKLSEYAKQPMRWLPYESSRGCPSLCTFCINTVTNNNRYRKKSAEKVIEEIHHIVNRYRLTHLKIVDDNFFVDIKRVRAICHGLIQKGIHITWDGECRCDYFNDRMLDDETLELCRKSGLIQLTLGIESGSDLTLKIMKKGISPEQAEHAVKKCNEHSIIARSSFILEIPGETIDDINATIRLINRLRKYPYFTCGVGTFRPYPKCELTAKLLSDGYLREPQSFEEWTNRDMIDMYTSAEYRRPWQANGEYSEKAAYYLNMESSIRLGDHQIESRMDKMKNKFFRLIAQLRNRYIFYDIPVDKKMYQRFLLNFYLKKGHLEKSGSYPLSDIEGGREQ